MRKGKLRKRFTPWLFLTAYFIIFFAFLLFPGIISVVISLYKWRIIGSPHFVGFRHYINFIQDPICRKVLFNTLYFIFLTVPALVGGSLALALLLNHPIKGRMVSRMVVFLPLTMMVSVVGVIWKWMYDTNWGIINYYLEKIGLEKIEWLTSTAWAMPAIAITTIWWTIGINTIIYLAALQDIPEELHEAAKLDGANRWQRFRHITLPALLPIHAFVLPMSVVAGSRVFGQVYTMTGGGPYRATAVIVQYIYTRGFQDFRMGEAAAAGIILLMITLGFTIIQLRLMHVI